ncbi:TPA: Paratox [Streptococcus suis]
MLFYEEFKEAIDRGFVETEYVKVVRRDEKLVDYVLEGEPVKPHEIVSIEKVSDVIAELKIHDDC